MRTAAIALIAVAIIVAALILSGVFAGDECEDLTVGWCDAVDNVLD